MQLNPMDRNIKLSQSCDMNSLSCSSLMIDQSQKSSKNRGSGKFDGVLEMNH